MEENEDEDKIKIRLRDLQLEELKVLKEVDRICKTNNITYYLGEGTLLGAIRHNGFIPWDDDVDILMDRKNYDKFLLLAPSKAKSNFEIQHHTTVKNYWSPFIKVRLLDNKEFNQKHIAHLTNNNGPYIDIFPVDNVPKERAIKQKIQSLTIKYLRRSLSLKLGLMTAKNIKQKTIKALSLIMSLRFIYKSLDKTFTKYNNDDNAYMVNLASYYEVEKQTVARETYGVPRYIKFEDMDAPIPQNAEYLLAKIYGDYMKLPPDKDRVIKHKF